MQEGKRRRSEKQKQTKEEEKHLVVQN